MRKVVMRYFLTLLVGIIFFSLAACGANQPVHNGLSSENVEDSTGDSEKEEVTVIKVADSFPTTNPISKFGTQVWIERIEELGEGKIEVEYFPAEQLGKAASLLDVVKSKVADVAYLGSLYYADKLPLSSIVGNPGLVQDAMSGTKAYHRIVTEDLYELEYKPHGIKPLWAVALNPYQLVTSEYPIKTLDDFKGMKLRTGGGIQDQVIQALGGTPISVPAPEIYTSWERGTIDGTLISLFSWPGYQIDKLAKYASMNIPLSTFGVIYAVNEDVWDSWLQDVQEIVLQASAEVAESFPQSVMQHEDELMVEYEQNGIEFYEVSSEEFAKWKEKLDALNEEWIQSMEQRGLPGAETIGKFIDYSK